MHGGRTISRPARCGRPLAAIQLLRRRPERALIALCATGSAALYLFGLDFLYDLQHGIYANGHGAIAELFINVLSAVSGVMALGWSWRNRNSLLQGRQVPHSWAPRA